MTFDLKQGLTLLAKKDYKKLHALCIDQIKIDLNNPVPYTLLAMLTSDHGNHVKALELATRSLELDGDCLYSKIIQAKSLASSRQQQDAKQIVDAVKFDEINDPFLTDTLGVIYSMMGFHKDAIPFFQKTLKLDPSQANYHYNLGASLQFSGDFLKAKSAYESAITIDPTFYRAWASLVSIEKQTAENNHLDKLIQTFGEIKSDANAALLLGHAIAKTYEDLGHYEQSLDWLHKAKAQKKAEVNYDIDEVVHTFQAARDSYASVQDKIFDHSPDAEAIFVVGLPRTGTTLIDRILSSHPDIVSMGELNMMAGLVKAATATPSPSVLDTETLKRAGDIDFGKIGQGYIERIEDLRRGSPRFLDKMPFNFFYAGCIHKALPRAKIIALRRNPMDSCLSNYRQLFATQNFNYGYSLDLTHAARFYVEFDRLMAYWAQVIPAQNFLQIAYEDIVLDQENQTRRLLKFCELSWYDSCLNFHENDAPVATASSVQVRQPLYTGAIDRWKKYGDALEPLKKMLEHAKSDE